MVAYDWPELFLGLVLAAGVVALARLGLRGDHYRSSQTCRFACPRSGGEVDCELVQDFRTGQWKDIRTCSVFPAGEDISCERDCVRRLNLGFRLVGWQQRASGLWPVRPSA